MNHRRELITNAARRLDKAKMIRFQERTGYLSATDLGRTASHFYIKYDTIEVAKKQSVAHAALCLPVALAPHSSSDESSFYECDSLVKYAGP